MSNEPRKPEENPEQVEVEPGQGAPGDEHVGVEMAQTTEVNPHDEKIPTGVDSEESEELIEAQQDQEEGTGVDTTEGYTVTEGGELNNTAVEPEIYYE